MANYTAARSKHATLVGGTEDVVTLSEDGARVRIVNLGATNPIYFRHDGQPASVAGDNTIVVPPNDFEDARYTRGVPIRLISAGAQSYAVELI